MIKAKDATVLFGVKGRKVAEIKGATYAVYVMFPAYELMKGAEENLRNYSEV